MSYCNSKNEKEKLDWRVKGRIKNRKRNKRKFADKKTQGGVYGFFAKSIKKKEVTVFRVLILSLFLNREFWNGFFISWSMKGNLDNERMFKL